MTELKGQINSNERFVRWQMVLGEHLTNMNNLILTISIGVIAFLLSLLKDASFNPLYCEKLFYTTGLISIFLSILLGIATGLSRLIDFRATLQKIKKELNGNNPSEIDDLKRLTRLYGNLTWLLFYSQLIAFGIGILALLIAFSLIYSGKLF